jgi:predicted CXXCH cytochrome family protein
MTLSKTWLLILICGVGGICLLAGCSNNTRHKVYYFFFDEEPETKAAPRRTRRDNVQLSNTNNLLINTNLALAKAGPPMVVHKPYAERRCTECHASDYSQRLKGDVSYICLACHKAFNIKAKFYHAPVEDGQCTVCHAPHQSREKNLLLKKVPELCFDCHTPEIVFRTKVCAENPNCIECHDPHQEDRRFLLFPPGHKAPVRKMAPEQ